jgi:uncharacterized membrane protein YfcA
MGAIIFIVVMVCIASMMMTTRESRSEASRKLARWNPLFISLTIGMLAFVFWPRD